MMTASSRLFAATATAASLLALTACNKGGNTPPTATDSANSAAATSSPTVTAAEDATAAGVGQMSAATTMTAGGFVTAAATSDMYEIQAAKIAEQKSTNPDVKTFAAKMVHDHSASTAKLKSILAAGTVTATPPTDLDERRKGLINNLNAAAPGDFDKTYVDQQVAAHEEAETLLKGYVDKGDNAALKTFATGILPTVEAHTAMVKAMKDAMK